MCDIDLYCTALHCIVDKRVHKLCVHCTALIEVCVGGLVQPHMLAEPYSAAQYTLLYFIALNRSLIYTCILYTTLH